MVHVRTVTVCEAMQRRVLDCVWNVMTHAQKPDFVFWRNGGVHLNRRGESVQSNAGSRGVRISGSNGGYTMFRGSVKSTGYPLHSPVSPSFPLPCVSVCHHVSTAVYISSGNWLGRDVEGKGHGLFFNICRTVEALVAGGRDTKASPSSMDDES